MNCPGNPPPHAGFVLWKGLVPPELTRWAMMLRDNIAPFPYWQEWITSWAGMDVIARKDYHTWTHRNGALVKDICIPGITLYHPATVPLPPYPSKP